MGLFSRFLPCERRVHSFIGIALLSLAATPGVSAASVYVTLTADGNSTDNSAWTKIGLLGDQASERRLSALSAPGLDSWNDLANQDGDSFFAIAGGTRIVSINAASGALERSVDLQGASGVQLSIAYDTSSETLYTVDNAWNLSTVDLITGEMTSVGTLDVPFFHGFRSVGYDGTTGYLAATTLAGHLLLIDPVDLSLVSTLATGQGRLWNDIAYNPVDGELYLIDSGTDTMHRVNRDTRRMEFVQHLSQFHPLGVDGLAFTPAVPGPGSLVVLACAGLGSRRARPVRI